MAHKKVKLESKEVIVRFTIPRETHNILTEEASRKRVLRDGFYSQVMEKEAARIVKAK